VTVGQRDLVGALAETPVGPRLAALLASLDLKGLSGSDCVDVLRAQYRQVNHERARLFGVIAEVVLRDEADGVGCAVEPTEFAFDEVRAALVWTRRTADAVCDLAHDLVRRLPAVHAALSRGMLDEPKARIFSEWTRDLTDTHARALCDALVPAAAELTTGQLIEQIKRYAIALDPQWARRRYEQALRGRRVVGTRNPDGSANLAGYDLPVEQVAAACARLDALAKAAKHAGSPDPIDHIRANLFLGMTDGTYAALDDAGILARLLAGIAQPRAAGADDAVAGDAVASDDAAAGVVARDDAAAGVVDGDNAAGDAVDRDDAAEPTTPDAIANDGAARGPGSSGPRKIGGRPGRRGLALHVRLTSLLGHDRYPAELAGWGPVHAELARAIAASHAGGHWRYVVTDRHGSPVAVGPLRRRPAGWSRTGRVGTIEIQVPEDVLRVLAAAGDLPNGWGRVVAEIVAGREAHSAPIDGDGTARLPGAALRRWLQVRDGVCVFPTCRAPARDCDADHTVEHARGGATTGSNLDSACRHDHRLRHDGGWLLRQVRPGHLVWTSRLGHAYHRRPRPVMPRLPPPIPGTGTGPTGPDPPLADRPDWAERGCMATPPEPARAPPSPSAMPPTSPDDDDPPF
jgi:hypothetical protein